jgi:(5-formylfuran-3-yl)methyl phosphate synthase
VRLLVSVANAAEASAALAGGADLIDAKDPAIGALTPVTADVFREIHASVGGARPVTAAIGNAVDEDAVEQAARAFGLAGARYVKVGFAGIGTAERVGALTKAAVRGARAAGSGGRTCDVVAVAYADADRAFGLAPFALVAEAAQAGAAGVLLDTADKTGPALRSLLDPNALAGFVSSVHETGLFVALGGRLSSVDLPFVRDAGADIAGVRGAACDGGRTGPVSAEKVRLLQQSHKRAGKDRS